MNAPARNHEQWADAVGSYLLEALPEEERGGFEAHLRDCHVCQEDVGRLQVAADALPASAPPMAPPPELKRRIMAVVEAEAELLGAADARAAEAGPDARPENGRSGRRRGWLGGFTLRPAFAAVAAVALLALGVAIGVLAGDDPSAPETRTVAAQVDEAKAPGASAELIIGADQARLVLDDLPQPPDGRLYQLWTKRPGEAPVPAAALFAPRSDGSGSIDVPGSLEGVEAVLVTDEPLGGATVPSRQPVIAADPA